MTILLPSGRSVSASASLDNMDTVISALQSLLASNRRCVVATIVSARGSTPRKVGAKMIVAEGRKEATAVEVLFSIGGGPFEALAIEEAKEVLANGIPRLREYRFNGNDLLGAIMHCGGVVSVFFEPMSPPEQLYIFGSGTVALAVTEKAKGLRYAITVFDDRPERFSLFDGLALTKAVTWERADSLPDIVGVYALILTRCHRTDKKVLAHTLGKKAAYLGLIGSRRKLLLLRKELEAETSLPSSVWSELHAPVGMSLGAETPEEIAISIWAEIIAVRSARMRAISEGLPPIAPVINKQDSFPQPLAEEEVIHGIL